MSHSFPSGGGSDPDGKVRVAFQTESTQIGGAEHSMATVIRHLGPRIEAEVIAGSREVGEFLAAGGAVRRIRVTPPISASWHVHRALRTFVAVLASRPHILHVNQTWIWARPVAICAGLIAPGARVVVVEHNQPHPSPSRNRVRLARRVASRLAAWVAVSENSARLIESYAELPAGSVRTIYNGVEPVAEDGLAKPGGSPPTIGAIGRLSHEKGYDLLLTALARMPEARAVIVGDGPERGRLESKVAELRLGKRVRMVGQQHDVRPWLRSFDVLAAPSRAEGSPPLVVLEAMMAGVPVVAAEVGGVPEAIADGATGLLVPSDDPAALAASLTRLLGDPELRRRLVDAGRRRARERFTATRMGIEFETLYGDVLGIPGGAGRASPPTAERSACK